MPRYYLHLRDGVDQVLDEDGSEHGDLTSLHASLLETARDIICHDAKSGRISFRQRIDAEDEHGTVVLTMPFAEAVLIDR